MKQSILAIILLIGICIGNTFGQSGIPILLGIQPGITVEPFYEEGELDVNVFPLLFETPIASRVNIKLSPIINYHIGGEENGFSDIGIFTVFPVFFKARGKRTDRPYGIYIGPVLGFGRNLINKHYTTTLAIEPGYMFESKRRFSITLGIQFGASYFSYDANPNKWVFHWGPKITLGFWLN
jgi:hypothetical protein